MFKKVLAFFAAMSIVAAFAAVDVNKASEAELDGIKGIGPATTKQIVSERKKGDFKSWEDFIGRVKGVGDKNAAKFSASGLTVSGTTYTGPATADKPVATKAKDAVKGAAVTTKDAVTTTAKDAKNAMTPKKTGSVDASTPAASAAK